MKKITFLIALGISSLGFSQPCFDSGTGADGAYIATVNTTIAGGTYHFTSFTINPGVTVNVTGTVPLEIFCQGTMTINGTLSANGGNGSDGIISASAGIGGIGVAGGGNGGDGSYSASVGEVPGMDGFNTGGVGTLGAGWSGGGGAGYATAGQASGGAIGGFAGSAYGTADLMTVTSGSGGGGGSGGYSCGAGGGGAGGGVIIIHSNSIDINAGGIISSNGGNGGSDGGGNCGGGGAGSGGTIWIQTPILNNNGSISAIGGIGGASTVGGSPYFGTGANGAVGRVRIDGIITGNGVENPAIGFIGPLPVPITNQTLTLCYAETVTVGSNTYSATGNYSDTLQTSAGCDSIVNTDLTILAQNETAQSFTICDGESVTVGTNIYSADGTYTDILTAANGCDSSVITTISVEVIDASFETYIDSLYAVTSNATYQWFECSGGNLTAISGATSQALSSGIYGNSYALAVSYNGCTDTSDCVQYVVEGVNENIPKLISIFPNPTNGTIHLDGIENVSGFESLEIYSASGQKVAAYTELRELYDLSNLNEGVYFLQLQLTNQTETVRFIKN